MCKIQIKIKKNKCIYCLQKLDNDNNESYHKECHRLIYEYNRFDTLIEKVKKAILEFPQFHENIYFNLFEYYPIHQNDIIIKVFKLDSFSYMYKNTSIRIINRASFKLYLCNDLYYIIYFSKLFQILNKKLNNFISSYFSSIDDLFNKKDDMFDILFKPIRSKLLRYEIKVRFNHDHNRDLFERIMYPITNYYMDTKRYGQIIDWLNYVLNDLRFRSYKYIFKSKNLDCFLFLLQ